MKRLLRSITICLLSPLFLFSLPLNERYADILRNASGDYFSFGYSYADLGEIKLGNNNNHIGTNPSDYYAIVSKDGVKMVCALYCD
jgi:hypothetical protein